MRFDSDNEYNDLPDSRRGGREEGGLFYWTIFILLLILFAVVCWAGSYFIFSHPEQPYSYELLKKLKKLESPQKFELTAAPKGEFLDPKGLLERYGSLSPRALEQVNAALIRNFIRNYKETRDLVPYIIGSYTILDSFELTSNDFFPSGIVAVAQATDAPLVLLENVFTAEQRVVPTLHRTLLTGLTIQLEKRFDLSALIHVQRLSDGRILFTTLPILYGSYASNHGPGSFSLAPPNLLNIKAGLPILSQDKLHAADKAYTEYRQKAGLEVAAATPPPTPKKAASKSSSPPIEEARKSSAEDRLVRIEKPVMNVMPAEKVTVHNKSAEGKKRTLTTESAGHRKPRAVPPPTTVEEIQVARALPAQATLTATPFPSQPGATPEPTAPAVKAVLPADVSAEAAVAEVTPYQAPSPSPTPLPLEDLPAAVASTATTPELTPSPSPAPTTPPPVAFTNIASGNWQTYEPGKMPLGRLVNPSDMQQVAEEGIGDERIYLKGNFLVTASRANRAVLRSQNSSLRSNPAAKVRIIVEYPTNSTAPQPGSSFNRGAQRPFLITNVQKAPGGMVNVFVREITHD